MEGRREAQGYKPWIGKSARTIEMTWWNGYHEYGRHFIRSRKEDNTCYHAVLVF